MQAIIANKSITVVWPPTMYQVENDTEAFFITIKNCIIQGRWHILARSSRLSSQFCKKLILFGNGNVNGRQA